MATRKQELLEELNKIRSKEVEAQLLGFENVEGSAIAQLELEKAKTDHKVKVECSKADHEIKVATAKAKLSKERNDSRAHNWVMGGDFLIKFLMALFISISFLHIVYTGNVEAMGTKTLIGDTKGNGNFQLLSVIGPLFGMVLSYYFGKSKSSANGE